MRVFCLLTLMSFLFFGSVVSTARTRPPRKVSPEEQKRIDARRHFMQGKSAYYLRRFAEEEGLIPPRLTPRAEELLKAYDWPGNLRELRSVIERAMLLACEEELDARHLPAEISRASGAGIRPAGEIIPFIEEERAILKHALEVTGGKIPEAAKRLAIGRATLYRKVKKYNLR